MMKKKANGDRSTLLGKMAKERENRKANGETLLGNMAPNKVWKKVVAPFGAKGDEGVDVAREAPEAGDWDPSQAAPAGPSDSPAGPSDSCAACPEVKGVLDALQARVVTVEGLVWGQLKDAGGVAPSPAVAVGLTPAQREAIRGLSGNVRGLISCVDEHRRQEREQQQKQRPAQPQCGLEKVGGMLVAAPGQTLKMLREVVVIPAVSFRPAVPKELVLGSVQQRALCHIYGGTPLPPQEEVRAAPPSLKGISTSLINANRVAKMFQSQVSECSDHLSRAEMEFLPREFGKLGLAERRRLAEVLSWEGLGAWGFDTFEVERLSRVPQYRRTSTLGKDRVELGHFCELDTSEVDRSFWTSYSGPDGFDLPAEQDDDVDATVSPAEHGAPLVLVGWAVLASPYSQLAMAKSVKDPKLFHAAIRAIQQRTRAGKSKTAMMMARRSSESVNSVPSFGDEELQSEDDEESGFPCAEEDFAEDAQCAEEDAKDADPGGYFHPDELEVSPRAICRFLRKVEKEYSPRSANPYHCNIHAADVLQATHALIRLGGPGVSLAYTPQELYAVLLAAALHDIRHPGTSNSYEVNAETKLSVTYNDVSVLENMHASRARVLLAADFRGAQEKKSGIFGAMKKDQRRAFRTDVVRLILATDMSLHFQHAGAMGGYIAALEEDSAAAEGREGRLLELFHRDAHAKARAAFLPMVLHLADVSNPARPTAVSAEWTAGVYEEFFLQGDRETKEGLPVSPLCDRRTTCPYESQLGFMKFVIQPAFVQLAQLLPRIEGTVLKHLEDNFDYWEGKVKAKSQGGEEGAPASQC